jgi:hypothetical protein
MAEPKIGDWIGSPEAYNVPPLPERVLQLQPVPCTLCGKPIAGLEFLTAIFAGYDEQGRQKLAHKECWEAVSSDS